MSRVGVYIPSDVRYANQYLLRQARAIPDALIVTRNGDTAAATLDTMDVANLAASTHAGELLHRGAMSASRRLGWRPVDPWTARQLRRAYSSTEVAYTMFLPNGAELLTSLTGTGTALATHAAGSDVTALGGVRGRFARWSLDAARRSDLTLCGSEFLQGRLHDLTQPQRSEVHYIGVPVPPTIPERREDGDRLVFLAVARLHPVKGIRLTIEAFGRAFTGSDDVELRIVGDGPEGEVARREAEAHAARIRFVGELDRAGVDAEFARAHVFVQHNQRLSDGAEEALGGSLLEASAVGLPVVAARSGGVGEAVVDGTTGHLVTSGDVDAMAAAMHDLADDETRREAFGIAGHRFVREHHNARVQDQRLAELLSCL